MWSNYQDRNGSCPINSKLSLDIDGLADDAVGHDTTCAYCQRIDASKNMARAIVTCRFSQRCSARFRSGRCCGRIGTPGQETIDVFADERKPIGLFLRVARLKRSRVTKQ